MVRTVLLRLLGVMVIGRLGRNLLVLIMIRMLCRRFVRVGIGLILVVVFGMFSVVLVRRGLIGRRVLIWMLRVVRLRCR